MSVPRQPRLVGEEPLDVVDLEYFVAVVVDHLDGDLPRLRAPERPRLRRVQGRPGRLVDVRLERGLQALVGVVVPGEVAVPDEERLAVIISVDHPQRDLAGAAGPDLAR